MSKSYLFRNKQEEALAKAFASLTQTVDVGNFLRDLLTLAEIEEFANRLAIAKKLAEGESYLSIARAIGVSTTTVTRVAQWLHNGHGGYAKVISKLMKESKSNKTWSSCA